MILTILGIIMFSAPLLLVFYFKDKVCTFLSIITVGFLFHLFLALITQWFHVFTYSTIITINALVLIGVIFFLIKFRNRIIKIKINWFLILAIAIIFFELWTIHNFYTGPVNTIRGPSSVIKSSYPYPYYSDEWIGASLENYSIKNHSLPAVNPLNNNKPFGNPMLAFFSVFSEFFLLFNLDPITHAWLFALFSAVFICLSIYLLLRSVGVSNIVSAVTILCIPFITNGANLPGIWYLMPFIVGLVFFIVSLVGIVLKDKKLFFTASFLSLLLYPPMIIFIIPVFVCYSLAGSNNKQKINKIISNLTILLFSGIFVSIFVLLAGKGGFFIKKVISYILRPDLDGGIPYFALWNIIPIILLPFVFLGIALAFKRKTYYVLAPVITGVVFWLFYFNLARSAFIIEYSRVVVITSVLLMFFAGLAFDFCVKKIKQKFIFLNKTSVTNIFVAIVFVTFIILAAFYPMSANWKKLVLNIDVVGKITPAAPINRYLTEDDLRLFGSISGQRFIAPPWKGLVIGVTTGNYPLESKPSTISNSILSYKLFMSEKCSEKTNLSKKFNVAYVYADSFECKGFDFIGKSGEGLVLYKVNR